MKMLVAAAIVSAAVVVPRGSALAQPVLPQPALSPPGLTAPSTLSMDEPATPAQTKVEWYGWQILVADGATFTLAAATEQGELALGWIGTGAAVHAAHKNYGRAVLSVGMRVGLPVLGAAVGAASAQCSGSEAEYCGLGEALLGGLIGMGTAEVIDLVMAKDEHVIVPARPAKSWTPVASIRHSGATFGIAARF